MPETQPRLVILAGPNGAGKTTASQEILQGAYKIDEFVNADLIAKGISPFTPESVSILASRVMLKRMERLVAARTSFATEITLASRTLAGMIKRWRQENG